MKVKSLSGRVENWNLNGYSPRNDDTRPRSELHIKARQLLREEHPTENILEEVPIPGEQLFIDFFLPLRKLAIEVNGEEHYKYVRFFHGSIEGFQKAKLNDSRKSEWCQLNNIRLVIFPFNKSVDEWRQLLWD